jgi:hypothetical protein
MLFHMILSDTHGCGAALLICQEILLGGSGTALMPINAGGAWPWL